MKTIAYILVALSVLAGAATIATAFDAKKYYDNCYPNNDPSCWDRSR